MTIEKVVDNVYAITDGSTRGNVAAIVLPSQIIFIDSGMNIPIIKDFRKKLEKDTGKKASTLIITHQHSDHIFGNQVFEDCKIITSKKTYDQMLESNKTQWTPENLTQWKQNAEDPKSLEGLKIVLAKEFFEETFEIVDGDEKILVKETGGHTNGSSYVFHPKNKVIISGDNLFNKSFPWGGTDTSDPYVWINALEEYLNLDVDNFIPGHGPISGKDLVKEFLAYMQKIIGLMEDLVSKGVCEEKILQQANDIEYYAPRREQWKALTLKKWYDIVKSKE
ncbi:MAG: MBL fold metallo-hydrolase [Candidatus Thorarchaeota archaeon]